MNFLPLNKSCISVLLLALITSLSACNKPAETTNKTDTPEANTSAVSSDAANKGVAYVSNQDGGVSVIDLATMQVTKIIDVKAAGPRGLGITDDGKKLIVATRENESISVIDTATGEVLQQIPVGKNPEFVRIRGNFAFISSEPSAKGGPPPKPGSAEAKAEEKDDDEEKIPAKIAVVDLIKGEKIRDITGGPETEGIEFSPDGKNIVITNEADNTITVHNIESGELVKTIKTHEYGDRPRGIKVSPDGNTYVATLEYGNKFMVLDKDFNFVRTVDTGETPYGISFDASGKHIYVASNKSQLLEVFAADNYVKLKEAATGKRCWHFTFTPDNKQVLLACGKSDAVLVYDAESLIQTGQIEDKKLPWGIVTYPKAMGSLDSK